MEIDPKTPRADDGTPLELKEGVVLSAQEEHTEHAGSPHSAFIWNVPGSAPIRAKGTGWLTLALLPIFILGALLMIGGVAAVVLSIGLIVLIIKLVIKTFFGGRSARF